MNLSSIPYSDREAVYFGLLKWMIHNGRYSWLASTKHSKVNSVSVSNPLPIKGGVTNVSVTIQSQSAGFDAKVISSNTTYYLRAFGYNGKTSYGPQLTINTPTWGDGEIIE